MDPSDQDNTSAADNPKLLDGKYSLADLIDLEALESTLKKFSRTTGFTTGFVSYPDQKLLFGTGWRDICTKYHRACPESEIHCKTSNKELTAGLKQLQDWNVHACACGLVDAATPIVVRGTHIASLFTGQILTSEPDTTRFIEQAEKFGYEEAPYLSALSEVPVVSEEKLQCALAFLSDLAVLVAEQGLAKMRALEKNQELEKLLAERDELISAVGQTKDTIVITDAQGTIRFANPAFEAITGYSVQEAMGQNTRFLKSGAHNEEFYSGMWKTLTQGLVWEGRIINKKKDGSLFTEDVTISPVRDRSDNVTSYVAVKRDVTREIELEKKMRQIQKMEAVGQLAGGIAHDFNNLLLVIDGNAELAGQIPEDEKQVQISLSQIRAASEKARVLVSQLLAFSRRQVIQPEDLDLNKVVEGVMDMIPPMLGEHIELEFIAGHGLATVCTDQGQMEQVLMNLSVNARDAMDGGGKLIIETQNVLIDEDYCKDHPWARSGRYVLLSVTDTGVGMQPEIRDQIFEPFFTTKDVGKGTGLGLATVYGIIKQNNGHVQAYSEVGKGSIFKIYLPAVGRRASDVSRIVPGAVTGGTETVLLAEDNEMVRNLTSLILTKNGYTVIKVSNGQEVIDLVEKKETSVDLIILDVVMPRMGGNEASLRLQKLVPDIPLLFTSGYSTNGVHINFIKKKGLHLLQKPFRGENLLRTVRELLDGAQKAD